MSEQVPAGVTLNMIVQDLVERHGWAELAVLVPIRCFEHDPSVSSSLKFLRRTPWARTKVERIYLQDLKAGRTELGRAVGDTE
jgi:uncharacterized protein (DUF2132 family)